MKGIVLVVQLGFSFMAFLFLAAVNLVSRKRACFRSIRLELHSHIFKAS